jgi:Uma2 family endonuclease
MTIDEFERYGAPEGLWELVDGELVPVNPTGEEHTSITLRFILRLGSHVTANRLGTIVLPDSGEVGPAGRQRRLTARGAATVQTRTRIERGGPHR